MKHRGLVQALFLHGTIETSESKAKTVKSLVDKIINLAKAKTRTHLLQNYLPSKDLQERLIKEIVPKLGGRNSGYMSIVRLGSRLGDQAMMVRMSLIGAEELKPIEKGLGFRVQGIVKTKEVKKEITKKKVATKKPIRKTKSRTK